MNSNLFWGLYTLAFATAFLLAACVPKYLSTKDQKRCSAKTRGTVADYTMPQYHGIMLPVVDYTVDGKDYSAVGPFFKINLMKPLEDLADEQESDIKPYGPLPEALKISKKETRFASVQTSPLAERYPIGASVDVYYDPKNSKRSYAERYIATMPPLAFRLPLILGIILAIIAVCFLAG